MLDAAADLHALLLRGRALRDSKPFFATAGGDAAAPALTGGQFAARALQAAAGLRARGFATGDRLAIHLHRGADEAIAFFAAALAGGIAVPIHGKLKDDQIAHVLQDCAPWGVVTSAVKATALRDPAGVYGKRRLLHAGERLPPGLATAPFAELAGPAATLPPLHGGQPATILYTSGSTGPAKGIVQTHGNLALGAAIVAGYLDLGERDHVLALLSFAFDYGLNQLLSALHAGGRITAADHLGAGELASLLATVRPTGLAGVPSLWHEVAAGLAAGTLGAEHGASLRYVTNSGGRLFEPDLRTIRARWPHVRVFAMYGLTEAFRSAYLDPAEIDRRPDSFGKALPGVELLLVDPASGAVLEGPATGELVHCGALVATGYWNRPAETAARFRRDPRGGAGAAVYSGDLVRRDAEGYHTFMARLDRMLKVAGHRVSPDEVAAAVAGMDGVGEVAVFGTDGGPDGHRIVLCAAGDPDDAALGARILQRCRARLPAYMVPAAVRVLEALPHGPTGKVDVTALERTVGACTAN